MCGCGRRRNEVVTSVQAAQEAQEALRRMEEQAVREAETYAQSAINAVRNSSSN